MQYSLFGLTPLSPKHLERIASNPVVRPSKMILTGVVSPIMTLFQMKTSKNQGEPLQKPSLPKTKNRPRSLALSSRRERRQLESRQIELKDRSSVICLKKNKRA
jgi:hypothetical protein